MESPVVSVETMKASTDPLHKAVRRCQIGKAMALSHRLLADGKSMLRQTSGPSTLPNAKHLARVIRTHWGIENRVHWVLDVSFLEDASPVSTGNAAENLYMFTRGSASAPGEGTTPREHVRKFVYITKANIKYASIRYK